MRGMGYHLLRFKSVSQSTIRDGSFRTLTPIQFVSSIDNITISGRIRANRHQPRRWNRDRFSSFDAPVVAVPLLDHPPTTGPVAVTGSTEANTDIRLFLPMMRVHPANSNIVKCPSTQ